MYCLELPSDSLTCEPDTNWIQAGRAGKLSDMYAWDVSENRNCVQDRSNSHKLWTNVGPYEAGASQWNGLRLGPQWGLTSWAEDYVG